MTDDFTTSLGRILVVGCGLIGASFAKAIRSGTQNVVIHGVEKNASHREVLRHLDLFDCVYDKLPTPGCEDVRDEYTYDWAILAVPVTTACDLLPEVARIAGYIADVCSVKETICQTAMRLGLTERFVPSHPMAGLATSGPSFADGRLFHEHPWILIAGWPSSDAFRRYILLTGARPVKLPSASEHDQLMAGVSHGIHLMSVGAMLGTKYTCGEEAVPHITGPGFRDITRLAASPEGFWVDTLLQNAEPVAQYIRSVKHVLAEIETALEKGDADTLSRILVAAREAKSEWS